VQRDRQLSFSVMQVYTPNGPGGAAAEEDDLKNKKAKQT
jgi:hypothetical protein